MWKNKRGPNQQRWNSKISKLGLVAILATLVTALLSMQALLPFPTLSHVTKTGMLTGATTAVNAIVIVQGVCAFTTSNAYVSFNTIIPGTNSIGTGYANTITSLSNVITVTNGGYTPTNVFLSASNWNFASNSFTVSNTAWSGLSSNTAWNPQAYTAGTTHPQTTNVEIQMAGAQSDTLNTLSASGTASFWFGVSVPSAQIGGTYAQTINVISAC